MKNDLQAGLQNIIDAINNLIEPKLGSLRYDKTFRAKVISDEGNNVYGVQINGKNYKAVYTGEKIPVGQIVKVKAPLNNFSDIYIETLPGSGSGSAGNYNDLLNKPILNTNNTGTQVPSATETIQGTISLHKVSKTGNYNDLLNKPTLDFIPTSEKGATNGVAGLDENKKVSKSNLPTDTVYDNNYVHTDNNFTTAMKNKLDSVEEGAEPNKIEIIQRNGSVLPINNKIVNVEVPTKTSDLTNNGDGATGSKYITNTDLNAELESKQDKITGGATTIVTNDLTVNRALVSNANGKVAVSNTTSTELGYLSGARSNLQNQIDAITTEGGQPNVIEVVQENGVPLEITNKTVNVIAPTNLVNGIATGSLRTVGATAEDSKYKLGRYAFAEGGTAIGYKSHTEGAGVTGSFAFTIISGDSTAKTYTLSNVTGLTVGMLYSIQYGNTIARDAGTITAINSSTKTITVDTYKTLGTKDNYLFILQSPGLGDISYDEGEYAHAEGFGVAVGDYSHAEGHNTKALWASSHAEGESTIARGWRSHAEGYGTVANGRNQHASGTYNIADNRYLVIVGNGSSDSSRSNAYTLDTNGNAWYSGEVYVGSTSGTHKDSGSKKLITLDEIPIASSRILGLVKVGSGLGIGTDGTLNVTGVPVVLYSNNSGSNGTITLSQTAANFSYLEIYYAKGGSTALTCSVKIDSPNEKTVALNWSQFLDTWAQIEIGHIKISGTSITRDSTKNGGVNLSGNGNDIFKVTELRIYKVLGYK